MMKNYKYKYLKYHTKCSTNDNYMMGGGENDDIDDIPIFDLEMDYGLKKNQVQSNLKTIIKLFGTEEKIYFFRRLREVLLAKPSKVPVSM